MVHGDSIRAFFDNLLGFFPFFYYFGLQKHGKHKIKKYIFNIFFTTDKLFKWYPNAGIFF